MLFSRVFTWGCLWSQRWNVTNVSCVYREIKLPFSATHVNIYKVINGKYVYICWYSHLLKSSYRSHCHTSKQFIKHKDTDLMQAHSLEYSFEMLTWCRWGYDLDRSMCLSHMQTPPTKAFEPPLLHGHSCLFCFLWRCHTGVNCSILKPYVT